MRSSPLAALWIASALCACSPPPAPNVLVISVDTLRPDHLGCYGYARDTAPSIDRLAAEGALFENAYATGPATVESHASLFTGRFPYQHGAFTGAWNALPDEEMTLAELLGEHGYRTLGLASSLRFEPSSNFQQGFQEYAWVTDRPKNERSRIVTDRALDWIGEGEDAPFFAFLHYLGPHEPYWPPEPYRSRWQTGPPPPLPPGSDALLREYRFPSSEMPAEALAYLEALYDAEILFLDRELTRLLEALDRRGLAHDTLVVLLSDHGEEFKEHGGLSHSHSLHDELLRIPLLVRWPGGIPAGRRVTRTVQLVDLLPTVLDLVGAPPRAVPGRSLRSALMGTPESNVDDLIIGQRHPDGWSVTATRPEGRFKLIAQGPYPARLFRLDDDPGEHRDVARDYPNVFTALKQIGEDRPGLARRPAPPAPDLPDDVRDRLEELGYTDEARSKPTHP